MGKMTLSCADCAVTNCNGMDGKYPDFCVTTHMNETLRQEAMQEYTKSENKKAMLAAAEVEHEGYMQWCRVREVMEFARKMGFKKIGIATCVGLIRETRTLATVLRKHGFEVFGIACKAGVVPKTDMGIDPCCCDVGKNICNPILQAKMLNEQKTELNLVMGLCVGHDSLFYRYSEALVTTVVTKDRVMGHNPVAALYTCESYYKGKLMSDE